MEPIGQYPRIQLNIINHYGMSKPFLLCHFLIVVSGQSLKLEKMVWSTGDCWTGGHQHIIIQLIA
jgi:hypothetical protein